MAEPLVIVGIGGFGREALDVAEAMNAAANAPVWDILGAVDDRPSVENLERLQRRGVDFLGSLAELMDRPARPSYAIGVGSPSARRAIANRMDAVGFRAATLIHPTVTFGADTHVGAGSVLCAGCRLTTNIRLGRHVHLNLNATVGHDSTLGDFVSVNPLASISGDCVVGDEVLIGVAGVILNALSVGAGSVVGGSACVVRDVPPGVTVKGVPAR